MREPFARLANSDAFEELCFDLLEAEGFRGLQWRGPGPDGGRDIEAAWHTPDPSGGIFTTKWYVESKWYTSSVPFTEIQPKLYAADAAKVDYLLLMTSSMVRNTALDDVDRWLSTRGHPFRFRYWTHRDLVHRLIRHEAIFRKHFGVASTPQWSATTAQIRHIERLSAAGIARMNQRLIPSIQWCQRTLSTRSSAQPSDIGEVVDELELLGALAHLGQFLDLEQQGSPARRLIDLSESISRAATLAERRAGGKLDVDSEQDLFALASPALLLALLFELSLNALMYSPDRTGKIIAKRNDLSWELRISNASSEALPIVWPNPGYRSPTAKRKNTAGQGLACWLSSAALQAQGLQGAWTFENSNWIVTLSGACPT